MRVPAGAHLAGWITAGGGLYIQFSDLIFHLFFSAQEQAFHLHIQQIRDVELPRFDLTTGQETDA